MTSPLKEKKKADAISEIILKYFIHGFMSYYILTPKTNKRQNDNFGKEQLSSFTSPRILAAFTLCTFHKVLVTAIIMHNSPDLFLWHLLTRNSCGGNGRAAKTQHMPGIVQLTVKRLSCISTIKYSLQQLNLKDKQILFHLGTELFTCHTRFFQFQLQVV